MAKEYDVFMAMCQRSARTFTELMNIFIKLAEAGAKIDLDKAKIFKKYVDEKSQRSVIGVSLNMEDCETFLKYNKEIIEDSKKLEKDEFIEKYQGRDLAFDCLSYKASQDSAWFIIKDKDIDKFKEFLKFLDEKGVKHELKYVVKDVNTLSNEDKQSEVEIFDKESFSIISNLFSSNHLPFSVVNHQNSDGLIINRADVDLAVNIIDKCGTIDPYSKSKIILNGIKPINDRSEAAENYKKTVSVGSQFEQ